MELEDSHSDYLDHGVSSFRDDFINTGTTTGGSENGGITSYTSASH